MKQVEIESGMALARAALADGKNDDCLKHIDEIAPLLTDPAAQADALFLRAQAVEAMAQDTQGWEDAALAYMRVYVHFRQGPGSDHSADALLKAATIEQLHLGEPGVAAALYAKVSSEYKGTPAA